jgi:hypothetical protein
VKRTRTLPVSFRCSLLLTFSLRHLGGRRPHLVVMPLVYDIHAVK